jgi:hypothetical protein
MVMKKPPKLKFDKKLRLLSWVIEYGTGAS